MNNIKKIILCLISLASLSMICMDNPNNTQKDTSINAIFMDIGKMVETETTVEQLKEKLKDERVKNAQLELQLISCQEKLNSLLNQKEFLG